MADYFEMEGQNYISSKRASLITGYAKDYIGQLCRMGKIEGKLIGRNWFVSERSLRNHKFGEVEETAEATASAEAVAIPVHVIGSTQVAAPARPWMSQRFVSAYAMNMPKASKLPDQRLLSGIDVRYYDGEPIFFTDDSPLFPAPVRVAQEAPVMATEGKYTPLNKNISADEISTAFADISKSIPSRRPSHRGRNGTSVDGNILAPQRKQEPVPSPFSILKVSAAATLMLFSLGIGAMTIFTERVMEAQMQTGSVSIADSYLTTVFK